MGITRLLKEDLKRFGIDLPVEKKTPAYKQKVREFRIVELYIEHLRELVRDAKKREKHTVAKYEKEVQVNKIKEEIRARIKNENQKAKKYSYVGSI